METEDEQIRNKRIEEAKTFLSAVGKNQAVDAEDVWVCARGLIKLDEFGWARRLLDKLAQLEQYPSASKSKFVQQRAIATYKDKDLNRNQALSLALEILDREFDLQTTKDQETLGLVGAIYKRRWEIDGNKRHLEQSLQYYRRGHELGMQIDGYTAINTAFVLDLLAYLEERQAASSGATSATAKGRREQAAAIRTAVIDSLQGAYRGKDGAALKTDDYWPLASLAEAALGLQSYAAASEWLELMRQIPGVADWEYETTARQLVRLVQVQADYAADWTELERGEAWRVLVEFLGHKTEALRTLYQGKLGLALSGGGFRASFYHIGVLAKMAELDLLRHVEVLSCVSGGSIIGAHYYLELRKLFNKDKRPDTGANRIEREDYIRLVENLVKDFTAGVQENPRVRILANPFTNLKMIFSSSYSRTRRLGELYEELIYRRVQDGEGEQSRWLNQLYINPVEKPVGFKPRRDNWTRRCKIPDLVLNATTLNSGHNWQYTASWMGESPVSVDADVDSNTRYRRLYYRDAPPAHRQVRLGVAVGASSCVPGLFEPVNLKGLYDKSTVRLVDGGVYDNQGVASLLEQDCSQIIVSDAVGQLNSDNEPGGGVIGPLLRSNSIMMHRIRGAQYEDLKARQGSGLLKGFAYMHLKQGLESAAQDWIGCQEPPKEKLDNDPLTDYGVRKDIQELLAGVRTDLDSFTDLECYALMTSGYLAADHALPAMDSLQMQPHKPHTWEFLKVKPGMTQARAEGAAYERLLRHLGVSDMTFFKVWKLSPALKYTALGLALALVAWIVYLGVTEPALSFSEATWQGIRQSLTLGNLLLALGSLLAGIAVVHIAGQAGEMALRLSKIRETLYRILIGAGVGIVGWLGAALHLHLFDKLFKRLGKVD